jgi:hypothetical protein
MQEDGRNSNSVLNTRKGTPEESNEFKECGERSNGLAHADARIRIAYSSLRFNCFLSLCHVQFSFLIAVRSWGLTEQPEPQMAAAVLVLLPWFSNVPSIRFDEKGTAA